MVQPPLFLQNTIAVIWDFDKTLIPGYMQEPLFDHFGIDATKFWEEVNGLPKFYQKGGLQLISKDTLYLTHILTYVRQGVFPDLNNKLLRELGAKLKFYPGLPNFLDTLRKVVKDNSEFSRHDIKVEHYIVSTGLRQLILGSEISSFVDGVWACEFVEQVAPPGYLETSQGELFAEPPVIREIGYVIDNTTKTRAVFEINKGSNKVVEIDVNATIKPADRRVPFQNMIYVADGPSDIPVFSVITQYGGRTFAVYQSGSTAEFVQVNNLQKQGRVQSFGAADYQEGSQAYMWLINTVKEIATSIVSARSLALGDKVGRPPHHIS